MKILMINKFFYIKGGSETYYFNLKKLLENNGHTIIDFSMQDEKNFYSPYSKYFVKNIEYNNNKNFFININNGFKLIYSLEAKHKLKKLIKDTKPDIAHLNLFQHQLSTSIIDILKKNNIPIIYTAHELKMICPNYQMLSSNEICEKCKKHKYYHCTLSKCIKNSYIKSFLGTVEAYINYFRKVYDKIDYIITPSKFYYKKFEEFGINKNKLTYIPNFIDNQEESFKPAFNGYYIYIGRLSKEKGLLSLLEEFKTFNKKLIIVGTGPIEQDLKNYVINNKIDNVTFINFQNKENLKNLIINAKCIIIPSMWYENCPYSIIETLQLKKPIIGANIGGIPEMIIHNKNGYLFKPNDTKDLDKCLNKFESLTEQKYNEFCNYSYNIYLKNFTPELHYKSLIKIYKSAIKNRNTTN